MSTSVCPQCHSSEVETEPSRGEVYCTKCGHVVESNIIVSELQFEEGGRGGSHIIGKHVGESGYARANIGSIFGSTRESRQVTLDHAKTNIKAVAAQLRLSAHCADVAFNLYKSALQKRLTYGRRNQHVIAACIYITCRTECTSHMLLDLSDVMQVNVYQLGKTYLKLSSALHIRLPAVDPCIYIVRFAARLDLGEKSHEIEMTAMRIAQRMKRDWMHFGRRPSGLCGAALLVAARLHDVYCTVKQIISVVKVCEATIRKRLTEFGDTPSSKLTLDDFMSVELEEEEDPPCFKASRRKGRTGDASTDTPAKVSEEDAREASALEKQIELELEKARKPRRHPFVSLLRQCDSDKSNLADESNEVVEELIFGEPISALIDSQSSQSEQPELYSATATKHWASAEVLNLTSSHPKEGEEDDDGDGDEEEEEEEEGEECEVNEPGDGKLFYDDLDDEEIDSYILDAEQADIKRQYWEKFNADWLAEVKEKEKREAETEKEPASGACKKKRRTTRKHPVQANSAGEAIEKMLQVKNISNKINYEVLRELS